MNLDSQTIDDKAPTQARFADLDWLAEVVTEFQTKHDVFTIVRVQGLQRLGIVYKNGRLDSVSESDSEGLGVQLFSRDGESALGSTNAVTREELVELLDRTLSVLKSAAGHVQGKNSEIWNAPKVKESQLMDTPFSIERVGLDIAKSKLLDLHEKLRRIDNEIDSSLSVTTSAIVIQEEWRIVRGDGGDVHWNVPRAAVFNGFTVKGDNRASSTRANIHERDLRILFDDDQFEAFYQTSLRYRKLAFDLVSAPTIKAGNYKLIIDAPLAKGLAHEAFGHAAESDQIRFSSILGENEKFRTGLKICSDKISIVDSSVEGDWAYAPYSSNGLKRNPVHIVKNGVLQASLADVYSANEIGVDITGASRLQSYGDIPIPRMSNIRLEIDDAYEWEGGYDPHALYQFALEKGLVENDEDVLLLSGYRGGQVNPKLGDYVFNCQAIYHLKNGEATLHQPALFSGKVLETLESIECAIGPQQIHFLGTCGKMGQGVPSSGGGPMFTLIKKHPDIQIGGR